MAEAKKALIMQFVVKDTGELHCFLCVNVIQNKSPGETQFGQPECAATLLQKFGVEDAKPVHTQVDTSTQLMKATGKQQMAMIKFIESCTGQQWTVYCTC